MTTTDLNFINGKATVKQGRKIVAKVFDRAVFYPAHNIKSDYKEPYQLTLYFGAARDCKTLAECVEMINKYI